MCTYVVHKMLWYPDPRLNKPLLSKIGLITIILHSQCHDFNYKNVAFWLVSSANRIDFIGGNLTSFECSWLMWKQCFLPNFICKALEPKTLCPRQAQDDYSLACTLDSNIRGFRLLLLMLMLEYRQKFNISICALLHVEEISLLVVIARFLSLS